jgi:hypothetical protein
VLRAEGKDVGGQGNAAATVTVRLTEQGEGTQVDVLTDLSLSGRVAQFGRGVIADVSNKMLSQFVQRLEAEFAPGAATVSASSPKDSSSSPRSVQLDDIEPLNVLSSMGGALAKRALPVVGVVLVVIIGLVLARRSRRAPASPASLQQPVVFNLSFPTLPGWANPQKVPS